MAEGWSFSYLVGLGDMLKQLQNLQRLAIKDDKNALKYNQKKEDKNIEKKIDSEKNFIEGLGYLKEMRKLKLKM